MGRIGDILRRPSKSDIAYKGHLRAILGAVLGYPSEQEALGFLLGFVGPLNEPMSQGHNMHGLVGAILKYTLGVCQRHRNTWAILGCPS